MAKFPWSKDDVPEGFRKVTIEMVIPEEMDSSDLLERVQNLAGELAEEFLDEDHLEGISSDAWENPCSVADA